MSFIIENSVLEGFTEEAKAQRPAEIVIPEGVTEISNSAFQRCDFLVKAVIPASVRKIGYSAFKGCVSLKSVDIPDGVNEIGGDCFYNCCALESIVLPEHLTSIFYGTLSGTKIKHLHIPPNVRSTYNFAELQTLESITVAAENQTFTAVDGVLYTKDMTKLCCYPSAKQGTCFVIPESVTSIWERAFGVNPYLEKIVFHADVNLRTKERFRGYMVYNSPFECCPNIRELENLPCDIPEDERYAVPNMFMDEFLNTALNGKKDERQELNRLGAIGTIALMKAAMAFFENNSCTQRQLTNLTELVANVKKYIPAKMFADYYKMLVEKKANSSLALIPMPEIAAMKEADGDPDFALITEIMNAPAKPAKNAKAGKSKKVDVKQYCQIKRGVLESFAENTGVEEVYLPTNVKEIYHEAFRGKTNYPGIRKLVIPKATERISLDQGTLTDLEEFEVDPANENFCAIDGVLYQWRTKNYRDDNRILYLFHIPMKKKTLRIPKKCGAIDRCVKMSRLEEISLEEGNLYLHYENGYLTETHDSNCTLMFTRPDIKDLQVPEGVTDVSCICNEMEADNSVQSIVMPDSVTEFSGAYRFKSTKSVRISASITKIDLQDYKHLEEVILGEGIVNLYNNKYNGCFENCTSLKKVVLPSTLKVIGKKAFKGCTALKEIIIPDSVTEIQEDAFRGCSSLTRANIPANTAVDSSAFLDSALPEMEESADFVDGVKYQGNVPVEYEKGVRVIRFKSGTTEIPENISSCSGDSVFIPETVTKLNPQSLRGFNEIIVDENNPEYASQDGVLFNQDKSILLAYPLHRVAEEYTIPATVRIIKKKAFQGVECLKKVVIPEGTGYIEEYAFYARSIHEIWVPYTASQIEALAFVTETPFIMKPARWDLTLVFYKGDIIIPARLNRNWGHLAEESRFAYFVARKPNAGFTELKDGVYAKAAAKMLYFMYDEKGAAEKYVQSHLDTIIKEAMEADSAGIIRKLHEDGLLDDKARAILLKRAESDGKSAVAGYLESTE